MYILAECGNIINSRPLTNVSTNAELTPNHFLVGSSDGNSSPGKFHKDDMVLRKEWHKSQYIDDIFWQRWTEEYCPTLTKRSKWNRDAKIIVDDQLERKGWYIGRIMNTFPGQDEHIRVVEVKTGNGIHCRPITKICEIEVSKM